MEPRNSRLASGSRFAIGSSSKNSSGFLASTRVRATWARSPPDRALIRARGRMASRRIRSDAMTVSNPPFMHRPISRTSATRSRGHSGASCATNPIRPSRCAGAPPAVSTVPVLAGSRPAAMLIRWSYRNRSARPAPLRSRKAHPGCSRAGPRCRGRNGAQGRHTAVPCSCRTARSPAVILAPGRLIEGDFQEHPSTALRAGLWMLTYLTLASPGFRSGGLTTRTG